MALCECVSLRYVSIRHVGKEVRREWREGRDRKKEKDRKEERKKGKRRNGGRRVGQAAATSDRATLHLNYS